MNTKIKVAEVTNGSQTCYFTMDNLNDCIEDIKESFVGDQWVITIVEMTQEEIDKLPEFQGW
jgi:methyl coenzyme M reductase subunit C-like uncharacterized protein (methanogenesis marker protein 7)